MPLFSRTPDVPNAIVGAARRVNLDRRDEVERMRIRSSTTWQKLAWRHYDAIGAVKFGYNYFSAVASRIRLYAGYQDEASDGPVPIGNAGNLSRSFVQAARYELQKLGRGRGGQPNLIRSLILNLLVPGEAYLVGSHDSWEIRSTSELRFEGDDKVRLVLSRYDPNPLGTYLPPDAFVARIWRTHPEYSDDADSSMKAVQDDCSELLLLSRIIRASARSRLNAGLLYVADELRFQRSSDVMQDGPEPNTDPFEEELTLALTEPIGETDSPSEVVPLVVRGPYEFKDGVLPVDLSRTFDETVVKRYQQVFDFILHGLDLPKDIVTGFENIRYSNAREITTDMYRAHVEPMIVLICEALTTVFLRPRLLARGYDPEYVNRAQVWYDPSGVLVKPDRSDDADKGYTQMLVSGDTWRRAHGFSPSDAPSDEEIARRVALTGSVPPSTTTDFIRLIAPELAEKADQLANASFGSAPDGSSDAPVSDISGNGGGATSPPAGPPNGTPGAVSTSPDGNEPQGGSMPPRDSDVLSLFNVIRAAADASKSKNVSINRTKRLNRALEVERRLRETLFTYLNETMQRSLERAGARTISKIRNDAKLKSLVVDVSMTEVFARVPIERRTALRLDEKQLVRDTIDNAHDKYVNLVTRAQRQGWAALGDTVATKLAAEQQDHIERSWKWLAPVLTTYAAARLREPDDDAQLVSIDTVRSAMTRAGGLDPTHDTSEITLSGRAIITDDALNATGWQFSGYRWVYGVNDQEAFHPHMSLDDVTFSHWESAELRNDKPWPSTRFLYPGDHTGCRCDVVPVPVIETASNGSEFLPIAAAYASRTNGNGRH